MNQTDYTAPALDSVLHPSDFAPESLTAFHHALKAALVAKAKFTVLHVAPDMKPDWTEFPGVRETLERWGLLPPGSPRSAVPQLGIDVRKAVARDTNAAKSVVHYLETHPADLIVLATHTHAGRASWLRQSVAEPIARRSGQMTLFIPQGVRGFVSAESGAVSLEQILIPVAAKPLAQSAVTATARLALRLQLPRGTFTLLHIGDAAAMPAVSCPEVPGWQWRKASRTGDVIHGIVDTAGKASSGLIVMATDGRDGFLDVFRGSHSERVLRGAPCPVLTVPAGSLAEGALQ